MKRIHATTTTVLATALALLFGFTTAGALAHSGAHDHDNAHMSGKSGEKPVGKAGNPKTITRTIAVDMTDAMRFGPHDITLKRGETIRFVVANKGQLPHEMVLGTMDELKAHGESMKANPHGAHDDPSAARVEPGQKGDLVWQFTNEGEFHFACLIPGHFEAGMVGKIHVTKG